MNNDQTTIRPSRKYVAAAAGAALGLLILWLAVYLNNDYGYTLFVISPVLMGALAALIYAHRRTVSFYNTFGVAVLSLFMACLAMMVMALEGFLCLVMMVPLTIPLAAIGAFIGWKIQQISTHPRTSTASIVFVLVLAPLSIGIEKQVEKNPSLYSVTSSIIINAPAEEIWENIVEFPPLPDPEEWIFSLGVSYPTHARFIEMDGQVARECHFNTGLFIEPITGWSPPERLAFDVLDQPVPMTELTLGDTHPPHLDGYFKSHRGEFRLHKLPNGQTRVDGTTWYTVDIWPESYWRLWCEYMIGKIHARVLGHIKRLSEGAAG